MPFQTISFNGDELPGHLPADIQFVVQQQQPYPACPLPLLLGGNAPLASRVPFRNRPVSEYCLFCLCDRCVSLR